jgi:hypothetical protein
MIADHLPIPYFEGGDFNNSPDSRNGTLLIASKK